MRKSVNSGRRPPWMVTGALAVLFLFVVVGIFAPVLAPQDPNVQDLEARLLPPLSDGHFLGTDVLGRDVLSRLIASSRVTLIIGFVVIFFGAVIGVALGLASGYFGGWFDSIMMRLVDVWLAFPFLIFAIALVSVLGPGLDHLILALVLVAWVTFARPIRGETLSIREREYILSARALGASRARVMFLHILPAVLPTILVLAALDLGAIILAEASLSFLGLGVAGDQPTWGGMLADGRAYVGAAWWLATIPGVVIFALVMSVNITGDWLRDVFDPRSQERVSRLMVSLGKDAVAADTSTKTAVSSARAL